MVNKLTKSALDTLIFELNNLEEVQKFKRLENLVKKDKTLANKVLELHKVSKQMTNAKEFGLVNAYDQYHDLYQNLLMDIESADETFNLRLEDWLNADDFNFTHDLMGIVNNVKRDTFPAKDFGLFVPRYASN